MDRSLTRWLSCPACRSESLALEASSEEGEIEEGRLSCSACGEEYEIREGIPYLLPAELRGLLDERVRAVPGEQFEQYQTEATPAVGKLLGRLAGNASVVLDIGSGRAPYLHLFGGDVVCLDLYPQFLEGLRERSTSTLRVHPVCASATHLPFRNGFADLVFASEVIEHLRPEEAHEALREWPAKSRRWCVIDTPNGEEGSPITRLRHLIYRTRSLTTVEHPDLPELDHHSMFSPETFREAGFECHGCIGWVSRKRFRVGPLWDIYDAIAWRLPAIGGTLVAVKCQQGV
jgi:uncharacterized protein YbaR (Trm112 family)